MDEGDRFRPMGAMRSWPMATSLDSTSAHRATGRTALPIATKDLLVASGLRSSSLPTTIWIGSPLCVRPRPSASAMPGGLTTLLTNAIIRSMTRRNRQTGTDIELIDNRDESFEVGGYSW